MYKAIFYILIFGIIFSSCKNENEKLIGHWHEFNIGESEFLNCFIITDSTFSEDKYSIGGTNRLTDIENYESPLDWVFYPDRLKSNIKFKKNEIIFGDSIIWRKQKNNEETFISDFSAGLKIDLKPKVSNVSEFLIIENDSIPYIKLYIGKVKDRFLNESKGIFRNEYYMQINDKITNKETDLLNYVLSVHRSEVNLLISADRNTPNEYFDNLDSVFKKINLRKKYIYFLKVNPKKLMLGYDHYH